MAIRDGVILAVGPSADLAARFSPRATWNARGKIVLPGLVNTHTHAAMTLLRGIADDVPLDRWLQDHIFPAEAKNVSPGFVYDGTLLAALEMIRGGTTTFADMYYFEEDAARAVDKAGLRAVLGETWIDFPVPSHKDMAETIAYMDGFVRRWKGHPRVVPAAAPHSSYTCSRETLLAARDYAVKQGIPILTHLSETTKEREDALAKWGKSPVAYEEEIGFFAGTGPAAGVPVVAAHCVSVDAADRAILKRRGVAVSHNPESNMKLVLRNRPGGRDGRRGAPLDARHGRSGGVEQRPFDARGHGLRREARQGRDGGPDRSAGARPRRRRHAVGRAGARRSATGSDRSSRASART